MKNKKKEEKYIPEKDELEIESNHAIDVHLGKSNKRGRVEFPEVEEEYTDSSFKADIAQQAGRFSDQVLTGSPSIEAGKLGKDALADIITASEDRLAEKMRDKEKKSD